MTRFLFMGSTILVICELGALGQVQTSGKEPKRVVRTEAVRPRWQSGDRWLVETTARQTQEGITAPSVRRQPVRWQFIVGESEKIGGKECYKIEVSCLLKGRHPKTVLWVEKRSLCIRQLETQIRTRDGFRTMVESYRFPGRQAAPILTPVTAVPLDIPVFISREAKSISSFTYEAISGPVGSKEVGDIAFAFEVEQRVTEPMFEQIQPLLHTQFAKGLQDQHLVRIHLSSHQRNVDQVWKSGLPWPIYANNGTTVARLVEFVPAKLAEK